MNKPLKFKILTGALSGLLLLGITVISNKDSLFAETSLKATPPQVEVNRMTRGTWNIHIDGVEFTNKPNADKKMAVVFTTITNPAGKEMVMSPVGKITAITGASGKVYDNFQNKVDIGSSYKETKDTRKKAAETPGNMAYEDGVFRLGVATFVDANETGITSITYTDESGKNTEIQVSVTPTIKELSGQGK